jgi:hypothetical protein
MKNKKHELLLERAKEAIDDLFSDTSVSKGKTREDLEELVDEIHFKIETIKE